MASQRRIEHASIHDNYIARQIEFTAEIDGDEVEFAVKSAVVKELSGNEGRHLAAEAARHEF